ncbi:membrane protein [Vibrio sp. qd031]|uniref:DMT family transporter n=1 Tax=Vibrio sp. qd031 TaxID=1603038 RepID=UPI000A0FB2E0|nr:DMT family transporter [Vibrio sp. qd031]ORT51144.1 membrane protein [Vibrio sp. qd031]
MPATLAFLIATLLWGSSFIALKFVIGMYHPTVVIFLRMLTTLVICATLLWPYVKRFQYRAGDWRYLVGMSLAEPCLYFLFEGYALEYTSASQAGVIVSCFPLIVAILAYFMLKERLSKVIVVGFLFCIAGGIGLTIVSPGTSDAPNPFLGNSLEFFAMLCAGYYTICVKHLSGRYSPLALIGLQGLSGTLFFFPFLFFVELPTEISFEGAAAIFYLGSLVTLGAYGMYNYAISKVSVLTAAAFTNLVPVFTLLLASLLLHETLTWQQWLAVGAVFLGVMIAQRHSTTGNQESVEELETATVQR